MTRWSVVPPRHRSADELERLGATSAPTRLRRLLTRYSVLQQHSANLGGGVVSVQRLFRSRAVSIVTTAIVTAAVVGGVAYAASPIDPAGVIHACFSPKNGAVKLMTTASCASGTSPIAWNQQGPQGDPGPSGSPRDCSATPFPGVNLAACDLTDVVQEYADFTGANLATTRFDGADLAHASLRYANLAGAAINNSATRNAGFGWTDMTGADLDGVLSTQAYFANATLAQASMRGAVFNYASFNASHMESVDARGATFWQTGFVGANLSGADFSHAAILGSSLSGANVTGTNFTGANLTGTICPNNIVHGSAGANC